MKFLFFIFIVYLAIAIVSFGLLSQSFFLQDEWAIFGNYLYWDKANLSWFNRLFVFQQYTHLIPLGNLVSYIQFVLFGLNFPFYAIVSIALHIVNALLVYVVSATITKRRIIAFLAGLLFITNSIPHQAITWTATTIGTAGSAFFLLVSLIFFIPYSRSPSTKKTMLLFSMICFVISLGFKETSLFAFIFYPFLFFFSETSKIRREVLVLLSTLGFLALLYVGMRFFISSVGGSVAPASAQLTQPSIPTYAYRLVTTPLKALAQSFVPASVLLSSARSIVKLGYPQLMQGSSPDPYVVESVAVDMVSFAVAAILLVVTGLTIQWSRNKKNIGLVRWVLISLVFMFLSVIPLIAIPGRAGYFSLLDGRHLYSTSIFGTLLASVVLYALYSRLKTQKFLTFMLIGTLAAVEFYHIRSVRRDLHVQAAVGQSRIRLLSAVYGAYPTLPQSAVFFVTSDVALYGLPVGENIPPFQSGFGQTLLVWYNEHGANFPACFFADQFLYELLQEGYRACDGVGFGYFRKWENLLRAVQENRIAPSSIIAFEYNAASDTIRDTTTMVRNDLTQ